MEAKETPDERWINTTDSPPPKYTAFIGSCDNMQVDIFYYDDEEEVYKDYFYRDHHELTDIPKWMPLPII